MCGWSPHGDMDSSRTDWGNSPTLDLEYVIPRSRQLLKASLYSKWRGGEFRIAEKCQNYHFKDQSNQFIQRSGKAQERQILPLLPALPLMASSGYKGLSTLRHTQS